MSELALDEISVLSSIYCEKDEFLLLEQSAEKGLAFRIRIDVGEVIEKTELTIIFQLFPAYPHFPPGISVTSDRLSRKQCGGIKQGMLEKASSLIGAPMVHTLLLWLQQNFRAVIMTRQAVPGESVEADVQGTLTVLILIDHMRSKTKYRKIVEKWTSELDLTGRLFIGKLILILLQGERRNLKEYLRLQKTVKVDVNSTGKPCKEKMMSILIETPLSESQKQIAEFEVREGLSSEDLKREFDIVGLLELYQEFVATLL